MEKYDETKVCRVCGYNEVQRWENYEDGELEDLYIICPCCNAESGPDDHDLKTVRNFRQEWYNAGKKWCSERRDPPEGWDPDEQLKNIPPEWQ